MDTKMVLTVLNIVFFSCLITSAVALKCFQCQTTTDKDCTYKWSLFGSIEPQECVENGSLTLNGLSPSCLKIFTTNYHGRIVIHQVVRQCIWKYEDQDPCSVQTTLSQYASPRTAHQECAICNSTDGCNTASSLKYFSKLVILGAVLSIAVSLA